MKIKVVAIVERDGDSFHAHCPAFRGLHVDGASQEEALENAVEALKLYMDSLRRHGDPLPVGPDCFVENNHSNIRNHKALRGSFLQSIEVPWWPSPTPSGTS